MFFYFDFHNYFILVRLALREQGKTRWRLLRRLLVRVPLVALFHAACFFLDGILFPGLHRMKVRAPVFIVGHPRSGTTLLHRLMCEDRERFSYFMLYELWLPSLIQKKIIRLVARLDARRGGPLARRLRAWEGRKFKTTQGMHTMGLTLPEEDDFVLTPSCASGWWMVMLPYLDEMDFYYIDEQPPARRRRLMAHYRECVKRQLYLNGTDRTHLSKNPVFCGRIESLLEAFPDARVVVAMRHPYETIPSSMKLMQRAWEYRGWDEARIWRNVDNVASKSLHMIRYPLEVLARHPETRHAVVDYRDLVAEPKRTVEQLYAQLSLPVTPTFAARLADEQKKAKKHEANHSYSLAEFGLDDARIHTELAGEFARFGWEVPEAVATAG